MQVIPVIDIRNGVAVRAIAGQRETYAPLVTPLAATSDPVDVARGLMSLHPFAALYVADLDAIERRGENRAAVATIARAIAPARLWIDAGFTRDDVATEAGGETIDRVFGSETLALVTTSDAMRNDPHAIFSLDFSGSGYLGDPRLYADAALWPDRLIVMTLARVGAKQGPDLARFREITSRAGDRRVYAAGGVRGLDDLLRLKRAGAAGALVATALHEGRLTAADLDALARQ
ncbi:HisA/HisF-related TIM barrel protein [Methylocystis echinoides]|uniref:Nickel transporter n=1 Tax=Methylocystis echinoides TaxID=29468 RepID=A0A9W6GRX9_9HYPH|nr:HisA/HisF-related TIM barrel protein [Methylocystis echinoides]GLI91795.1 nickel transporter [Methylocystis echinoides]